MRARFTGPLVRAATVKLFIDGVIETHTGYLAEPYADRPGFRGAPIWPPERLIAASSAAADAGFQLHYHAIGDAAVSLAVDAIAAARHGGAQEEGPASSGGQPAARDIITHLQLVDPRDYGRMAALGVVAAVQPYWFTRDPDYHRELCRLVGARADRQYPMRSLLEAGVTVAGASDYPVSPPPDPLLAIQRGVLRRDPRAPEADDQLWPEEAVAVETMIEVFTLAGARANFLEHETGSLEVGKSADLVVLRENLLELPAERIHEAAVELTLFRGHPVFAAGPLRRLRRLIGGRADRREPSGASTRARRARSAITRRGSSTGSPRTSWMSISAASRPCCSASYSSAVIGGVLFSARPKSLGPATISSPGTAMPSSAARRSTAIAGTSYTPKTASGRCRALEQPLRGGLEGLLAVLLDVLYAGLEAVLLHQSRYTRRAVVVQ